LSFDTIFSGTKMIFPLPEVEIVSKDNYDEALANAARSTEHLTQLLFG